MRVLTEAAGSLTAPYIIKAVREAGYSCIATDANATSSGRYLADEFYILPYASATNYSGVIVRLVRDHKVDMVIPTLDDGLLKWAEVREMLMGENIYVAQSDMSALLYCMDKWETYCFFIKHDIPTPATSLEQKYSLIKPRFGRGAKGIFIADSCADMTGNISQELLKGTEYTVDVLCNLDGDPIYIVPRKRLGVLDGKSTGGEAVHHPEIEGYIRKICGAVKFTGPINIQCFDTEEGIRFTEINPRLGGGSALGMAATENWIPLMKKMFVNGENIPVSDAKPVQYGLKMGRYYAEVYYR